MIYSLASPGLIDFRVILNIWYSFWEFFTGFLRYADRDLIADIEKYINNFFKWIPGFKPIDIPFEFSLGMLWDVSFLQIIFGLFVLGSLFSIVKIVTDLLL